MKNFFFDQLAHTGEQRLWDDLVTESIGIFGENMFYLPRKLVNFDQLTGTDAVSTYDVAIPLELYITSFQGFDGPGPFMSSFGVNIPDEVTFTVSKRRFEAEVSTETKQPRPNDGDVIYFPLNGKLFVIKYVNYKPFFYQHGALQTYDLNCELFRYSNEEFSTGIPEIDRIQKQDSLNVFDHAITTEDGKYLATEDGDIITLENFEPDNIDEGAADNQAIQQEANTDVFDHSETSPFGDP